MSTIPAPNLKAPPEGSRRWERLANQLARAAAEIVACPRCGWPKLVGRICANCTTTETP